MESGFGSDSLPDSAAVLPTPPPENMMLDYPPNSDQLMGMWRNFFTPILQARKRAREREEERAKERAAAAWIQMMGLGRTPMTAPYNSEMMGFCRTLMTALDNSQMMGLGRTPMTAPDNSQMMGLGRTPMTAPDNSQMMGPGRTPMTAPYNSEMMGLAWTPMTAPDNSQMMGLGRTPMTAPYNSEMMGLGWTPMTAPDNSEMMGLAWTPMTAPGNSEMMGLGGTLNSMGNNHITSNHGDFPMTYVPDHSLGHGPPVPDLTEWNPSVAATAEASPSRIMEFPKGWVKVEYKQSIYKFWPDDLTTEGLKKQVLMRIPDLQPYDLKFMYKDRDGEMVTIACDEDLRDCFNYFNKTTLRFTLVANAFKNP